MEQSLLKLARILTLVVLHAGFGVLCRASDDPQESFPDESTSSAIIRNYLTATQGHSDELRGASMEVRIEARIPKLKENGTLKALRKISRVGQITYRFISFQGDTTVKTQVIGRYLQAEQEGQGDAHLAITPENYKFKYKGQKRTAEGVASFVFQLSPRKKRVGLFRGELWLDTKTYLPVLEKGRLVKNPSIFFRKVDFERSFSIHDGRALPSYMISTIDTRLIGLVQLNISYSNFAQDSSQDSPLDTSSLGESHAVALHSNLWE